MKLRQWRHCAEMTQQQLANRAKVARASIAHLENGYYPPSPSMATRICDALGSELGMQLDPREVFEQTREDGRGKPQQQPRRRS